MKERVGFTGTRKGMTDEQRTVFTGWIANMDPYEFHDGDCDGSDEEAHNIVRKKLPLCRMIGHPPNKDKHRAGCKYDMNYMPRPYLERNKDIVDDVDFMVATPDTMKEKERGGTWYTIRYARKQDRKLTIIYPDGTIGE
ncbi:hypothetical protein LCGC14_2579560 [marine sediment metagenome]|uniref:Uncharacterized protein n=1 Tax=marine sediment metagenome TaxID=412755 RepID=A0A0F9B2N6_9ZZZZ